MPFDGTDVHLLASQLGLSDMQRAASAAGVMSILQVSAYYAERRGRHSVARVTEYQTGEIEMRVVYQGVSLAEPLRLTVARERMERLDASAAAGQVRQAWRPAGAVIRRTQLVADSSGRRARILHGVVVAPDRPEAPYSTLVNAIDAYLPAAIREIPLR